MNNLIHFVNNSLKRFVKFLSLATLIHHTRNTKTDDEWEKVTVKRPRHAKVNTKQDDPTKK